MEPGPVDLLKRMELFVRAVEAGSLSALARELGTTQPTLSRQIADLEQSLGTRLLQRGPAGLRLTEDGELFYRRARQLGQDVEDLLGTLGRRRRALTGTLRISAPVSFGETFLTPILVGLQRDHPDLSVDLLLSDRFLDPVETGIDVTIKFGDPPDARLVARRIGRSPQACLAAPAYLERLGVPERPEDLVRHRCILNSFVSPRGRWTFRGPGGDLVVTVESAFRANNLRSIREAVLAGQGIAIGPAWLYFDDLAAGRVTRLLQSFAPIPLEIHALYAPGPYLPARVRHAVELLEAAIGQTPAFAPDGP